MGFFSWVWSGVKKIVKTIVDKLSGSNYDETQLEDRVDVDATLAVLKFTVTKETALRETECMASITPLFSDFQAKLQNIFPDLSDLIQNKQEAARRDLRGTISKYVNENLSKNNPKFRKLLMMPPGEKKKELLDKATEKILKDATDKFYKDLQGYTDAILCEFRQRIDSRITDQENSAKLYMEELQNLKVSTEQQRIDLEHIKDRCASPMESAQCIVDILRTKI